jgi:hypothetical protein
MEITAENLVDLENPVDLENLVDLDMMSARVVSHKHDMDDCETDNDLDDCENAIPTEAFESKCIIAENVEKY